jgi:membrane fusion protein, multidrug efflux system
MAENANTGASSTAASAPPPPQHALPAPGPAPLALNAPGHQKSSGESHALWIVLVLAVVGAVVGYVIYKHDQKPPAKAPPPITVSTTNAIKGSMDDTVWGLGTVTPVYTAMISPRVDGNLVKVNYTEGQLVTTNDLLAEIDPGPYQAAVTQAEGALARDKALLEVANIDLTRYQDAYGRSYGTNLHAIPKQQVDDQLGLVHQDEGLVKYDAGVLSNADVQLAYCFIHAPFVGRTGLRLIDPGNVVHAANSNAIVVVAQLQPITVIFTVDQKYLPAIQTQLKAGHKMIVEAYNEEKTQLLTKGSFLTLDNLIDVGTGTIRIKAMFDNEDMSLFPNQFVNAKLVIDTKSNVTLIPTVAIQRNPQGAFLYVVTNQNVTLTNKSGTEATNETVVAMRDITVGVTDADTSSIEGVEPGEVVVTDNYNKLGDGMRVNVRSPGGRGRKGGAGGGDGAPVSKKKGGKKDMPPEDPS